MRDPQLGVLRRSRGAWRGTLSVPGAPPVPLVVGGSRRAPAVEAVAEARAVPGRLAPWRPVVAAALFEHYAPYADAVAAGELRRAEGPLPALAGPAEVWAHVTLLYVAVTQLGGALTTELGYAVAWDEEHRLGARFRGERFLELCGSAGPGVP